MAPTLNSRLWAFVSILVCLLNILVVTSGSQISSGGLSATVSSSRSFRASNATACKDNRMMNGTNGTSNGCGVIAGSTWLKPTGSPFVNASLARPWSSANATGRNSNVMVASGTLPSDHLLSSSRAWYPVNNKTTMMTSHKSGFKALPSSSQPVAAMATGLNGTVLPFPKNASTVHRPTMSKSATTTISAEVTTKDNLAASQTLTGSNSTLVFVPRPGMSSTSSGSISTLPSSTSRSSTTSTGPTSHSVTSTGRTNSGERHLSTSSSKRLTGPHSSPSSTRTESQSGATTLSTSTRSSVASVSAIPQQSSPHLDTRRKHQVAHIAKIIGPSILGPIAAGSAGIKLKGFLEELADNIDRENYGTVINKLRWALISSGIPATDIIGGHGTRPGTNTPTEPKPKGPVRPPDAPPAPPPDTPPVPPPGAPPAPPPDAPPASPPDAPPVSAPGAPPAPPTDAPPASPPNNAQDPPASGSGDEEEEYWGQDLYTVTPPQTPPVQPASGPGEGSEQHPNADDTSSLDDHPLSPADNPGAEPNSPPPSEDPHLMSGTLQDPNDPWTNPDYSPSDPSNSGSREAWEENGQEAWENAWADVGDIEERITEAAWLDPDLLSPEQNAAINEVRLEGVPEETDPCDPAQPPSPWCGANSPFDVRYPEIDVLDSGSPDIRLSYEESIQMADSMRQPEPGPLGTEAVVPYLYEQLTLEGKFRYVWKHGLNVFDSALKYANGKTAAVGPDNRPLKEGFQLLDGSGKIISYKGTSQSDFERWTASIPLESPYNRLSFKDAVSLWKLTQRKIDMDILLEREFRRRVQAADDLAHGDIWTSIERDIVAMGNPSKEHKPWWLWTPSRWRAW